MKIENIKKVIYFCILFFLVFPVLSNANVVKVRVILANVNVYLKPEINSEVLASVPMGTELESTDKTGDWFKVKLPPDEKGFVVTGFVQGRMVEVISKKDPQENLDLPPVKEIVSSEKRAPFQPQIYLERQRKTSGIEFGLRLNGNGCYLYPNDINDTLRTEIDYWKDRAEMDPDSTFQGEYNPLKIGYGGSAEFFVNFIPQIGIGVGAGYVHISTQMTYDYFSGLTTKEVAISPKIEALPITFSLYFGLPLGNAIKIFIRGGVEYIITKFNWNSVYDYYQLGDTAEYSYSKDLEGTGFGFLGGLGLEFNVSRPFVLIVEAFGRYAELKDFQVNSGFKYYYNGELRRDESTDKESLWFGEFEREGTWYPSLTFSEEKPLGTDKRNIRKGILALTGFSIQIGFKIKFSTFSN